MNYINSLKRELLKLCGLKKVKTKIEENTKCRRWESIEREINTCVIILTALLLQQLTLKSYS